MTNSLAAAAAFAVAFIALYAAHHIGDYWIQTDHQARHKGDPHRTGAGRTACLNHVLTYLITQNAFLIVAFAATGLQVDHWGLLIAMVVSGVTHYWADRRWTLEWLAGLIPGKLNFYRLGAPRAGVRINVWPEEPNRLPRNVGDLPTLGTGAWALDQSFHLMFSVFVPALIIAAFA